MNEQKIKPWLEVTEADYNTMCRQRDERDCKLDVATTSLESISNGNIVSRYSARNALIEMGRLMRKPIETKPLLGVTETDYNRLAHKLDSANDRIAIMKEHILKNKIWADSTEADFNRMATNFATAMNALEWIRCREDDFAEERTAGKAIDTIRGNA
jgi:hypothetical protein